MNEIQIMGDSQREQFECSNCGEMVWLSEDAPPGTECPRCAQPLGVAIISVGESQAWNINSAPRISLESVEPPPKVLLLIPPSVAREHTIFPISYSQGTIRLAVPSFVESEALDKVHFILNRDVELAIADEMEIRLAIERFYAG